VLRDVKKHATSLVRSLSLQQAIAPITFTPDHWNLKQRVTVAAVDDGIAEDNHTSIIQHQVTSTDANYQGISARDVTANIRDRVFAH
jgi:hypothetical protein